MDNINEEWKTIPQFSNYEASNIGRIRRSPFSDRAPNLTGAVLKTTINWKGYECVGLNQDGKKTSQFVHRLVAFAWIPNPDNLEQIDHINENKTDNRIENLRWVSCSYNIRRSQSYPLKGTKIATGEEKIFLNSIDAAAYIGGDYRKMQQIYDGNRKTHKGWTFERIDLDPKELIDQI